MALTKTKTPLNTYELVKTIGTGTFGRVYLTYNKHSNSFFAMKVLRKKDVIKLRQVEHINNERAILSAISFPFIVNLIETYQDNRCVFLLEDFVQGGEVFMHLRKAGRFKDEVAKFYVSEIVLALEYLHNRFICYRDLKPENLLLDNRGHIKITDFGFAKKVVDRTWTLCGTPEYLAPELILSKGHSKAVDWWALGILTFEVCVN